MTLEGIIICIISMSRLVMSFLSCLIFDSFKKVKFNCRNYLQRFSKHWQNKCVKYASSIWKSSTFVYLFFSLKERCEMLWEWVDRALILWTKHGFYVKGKVMFPKAVSFDLHVLRPTIPQFVEPFQIMKFVEILQLGVCLSDDCHRRSQVSKQYNH